MSREYRKRKRAEQEEETRLRITQAAVDLHGSVGPARTTVSAIAERAGVQRATVYRHFPDEEAMFAACSTHHLSLNPPPDPAAWTETADVDERLRTALGDLYAWYGRNTQMLENVTRDRPLVPALAGPAERMAGYYRGIVEALLAGRSERGGRRRRVTAAIGHALGFATWRSLVREQGLSDAEAVELMAGLVDAA